MRLQMPLLHHTHRKLMSEHITARQRMRRPEVQSNNNGGFPVREKATQWNKRTGRSKRWKQQSESPNKPWEKRENPMQESLQTEPASNKWRDDWWLKIETPHPMTVRHVAIKTAIFRKTFAWIMQIYCGRSRKKSPIYLSKLCTHTRYHETPRDAGMQGDILGMYNIDRSIDHNYHHHSYIPTPPLPSQHCSPPGGNWHEGWHQQELWPKLQSRKKMSIYFLETH